ncbi:MAG TPA: RNA polymerase sigma factor RpoH [Gammaproteobacteria bacterium]|jgi:RNA polymerase sigma-32 factor|nr:RNA polymerase sigma factor RpoH [Gammaproteobacteria bacterium]
MTTDLQRIDLHLPINGLTAYLHRVNQIPLLSQEEEQDLATRLRQHEDLDAARQLVLSHLRYVARVAKGYLGYGLPLADLVQEGNIGLMKAVKRFNPEVGVRLVTFAMHWIKAEIHEYILKNWRIVKVATTKAQRKLFFKLRSLKKCFQWMTQEEINVIAKDLGVNQATVREMEMRLTVSDASLDVEKEDEQTNTIPTRLLEDMRYNPAQLLENSDWSERNTQALHQAMQALDKRSQHILAARWLAEKKLTLQDLADHYHVSPERIRQLEKRAMIALKKALL